MLKTAAAFLKVFIPAAEITAAKNNLLPADVCSVWIMSVGSNLAATGF